MRSGEFILLLSLCAAVATAQAPPSPQITLENSELRVTLSARDGSVISVERKPDGQSYLGSSQQAGWFKVQLPLPHWEGHIAVGKDAPAFTISKRTADSVEFQTTELSSKEGRYRVASHLTFRLDKDNLVCSLHLRNDSTQTIDRIVFPIVDVPPDSDGAEALVMPYGIGFGALPLRSLFSQNEIQTTHNPFDTLDPLDLKAWFFNDPKLPVKGINYPMDLPTAWFTYVADKRGIGFDVRTRDFQFQKLTFERRLFRDTVSRAANRLDYEFSWNWYPLVRPGKSWQSPEVYIKFDAGDWHAIARQHRDWLRPWVGRPKVPKELQESIGWISRGIRSFDDIPQIGKQGVDVGAPYFIVYGWSDIGPAGMSYNNYPRRELGGIESLQRNLLKARSLGSYPMAWFNGTVSVETNLSHLQMGHDWTAIDRWGGQLEDGRWSFFEPFQIAVNPNNDSWFEVDPSSGAQQYLLDTARRFVEDYHFTGYEMDQGHKNFLSYRNHSENFRPEAAFSQGWSEYFSKAEEIVKKANPAGIIVGENPSELMNQYVDSTWIFEGGALNLATFTTLRYSWPWLNMPAKAIPTNRGHANQCFMMNSYLDIFDDLSKYPEYAEHLKRLHGLKKATSRYLYQGEFSDEEGFSFAAPQAGVMAKSYRDPAGKFTAVVVINTGDAPREVALKPDSEIAKMPVRHYYLDGRAESETASSESRLNLGAYDVQVIAFESQ
jgi:hypothetical protein